MLQSGDIKGNRNNLVQMIVIRILVVIFFTATLQKCTLKVQDAPKKQAIA